MNETYKNIYEALGWTGWTVDTDDGIVELHKFSPAGEDFFICVDVAYFVKNIKEYAAEFDQDEHIEMWLEARRNGVRGVPSTRELVQDAADIAEMLHELASALSKAELEAKINGQHWKLGWSLRSCDNLLDGLTFDELITAVHRNCSDITPEAVWTKLNKLLFSRKQSMEFLLDTNMDAIMAEARKGRE